MRKRLRIILAALALTACNSVPIDSPVPFAPVQIVINTKQAFFVHFIPQNINSYLVVNKDGYLLNGKDFLPRTFTDYYGYAGVVIFVNGNQDYSAFDLCCPNCVRFDHPCHVDGIFAVCPICGEEYDLSWGLGTPMHGISRYRMKRYNCMYSGDVLTVRN